MAVKPTRIQINMAALNQVQQALAFGLLRLGEEIARDAAANVAYATDPLHIREQWGVAIYAGTRKVANASYDGSATAKPRAFRTVKGMASGVVGFGFPARFHEIGTSDTAAEPFLSPAAQRQAGNAGFLIREGAASHWPRKG